MTSLDVTYEAREGTNASGEMLWMPETSATDIPNTTRTPMDLTKPSYLTILVTFFYSIIFVFGVIGNVMVILVVWRNKTMRNSTNVFLVNLSVADLSVILVCMPAALLEFYSENIWHLGDALCRIVAYLDNASVHASAVTILAISFERYYAICCPLKAQYICTFRRTLKVILVIWIITLGWTSPFLWMSHTEDGHHNLRNETVTICRKPTHQLWHKAFIISNLIIFFSLPFIIIVFLYSCIMRSLAVDNTNSLHSGNPLPYSARRQRRQIILMLLSVIVMFFVCVLPFRVISIWLIYVSYEKLVTIGLEAYLNILNFGRVMFYLNSAGNPILYNMFSTKFRQAFKQLCGCDKTDKGDHKRTSSANEQYRGTHSGTIPLITVCSNSVSESKPGMT